MPLQRTWWSVAVWVGVGGSGVRAESIDVVPPTLLLTSLLGAISVLLLASFWALSPSTVVALQWEAQRWCDMALDMVRDAAQVPLSVGTLVLRPFGFQGRSRPQSRRRTRGPAPSWVHGAYQQYGQEPGPLPPDAASAALRMSRDSEAPYYLGLYNPNIYCFMNSVVQSLSSVAFFAHFLDALVRMAERYDVPTPVADALRELVVILDTPQKRRGALTPKQFVQVLGGVSQSHGMRTLMSAHQQQDAQELALLILHALDQELGAVQRERGLQLEAQSAGLRGATAPSTLAFGQLRASLGRDGDDVANPFRGTSAQRTSCARCGYTEAIRYFSQTDLSLSVPMGVRACTLEQCLAAWTQLEQVEWVCHRCSIMATLRREKAEVLRLKAAGRDTARASERVQRLAYVLQQGLHESEVSESTILDGIQLIREPSDQSTKQVMLARTPSVLMLHLNRSSFVYGSMGPTKNNARVIFPELLDVAPYTTGAMLSLNPTETLSRTHTSRCMYRLSAVVVHYGAHHAGHYVAFRRRPKDAWTRISDDRVEPCTLDDVLAQNPYLLFYESTVPHSIPAARAMPHARLVHSWGTSRTTSRESTPLHS